MKTNTIRFFVFSTTVMLLFAFKLNAQLPSTGYFYYHTTGGTQIYNYNCTSNTSTLNTISLPAGNIGLAVNNNFFAGPAMTFYTIVGGNFHYYNGSTWVNTGHAANAVNFGGAGPYIYTFNGGSGQIYRYNGTGPAVLIVTLPATSIGGPYDVTGDASGNFFVLKTDAPPYTLKQYNPSGALLATYNLIGFPVGYAGGGFAFINGKLYADIGGVPAWGTITGTNITYGGPLTLSLSPGDFANWPLPIVPLPVELLSFTGSYNSNTRLNDLEWTTSTEINNEYFTIEYSSDAINWEFLANIDGAGSSNLVNHYEFNHDSPYPVTYYQLTQTDYDGQHQVFDPIQISRPASINENELLVYPNPASHLITVETEFDQPYDLVITDETGRVVFTSMILEKKHGIDISELEPGLYFITTEMNGVRKTSKLIKN